MTKILPSKEEQFMHLAVLLNIFEIYTVPNRGTKTYHFIFQGRYIPFHVVLSLYNKGTARHLKYLKYAEGCFLDCMIKIPRIPLNLTRKDLRQVYAEKRRDY